MRSLKFIFLKFPFTLIFTGLFLALFLAGCGQTGDRQTTIGPGAADNFSSPIPTQLQKLRTGLNAKVIVDGGTPRVQIVNLQVDTQNDRVIGTIPNLPVGQHTFEIQYFIDNALIATAPAITVNIQANVDTPVPFNAGALVYPDTDGDGFTNLNEVEIFGSASDAWTRPDLKPEVSVVVNPGAAILPPNGVQTFTAAIAQNANQGVNWSLEEPTGGGSITPGGTYTAPAVPGIYNVVATSQADPAKSATIPVLVVTPGSLDTTSFGSGGTAGTVAIPVGNTSIGQAVAIQPDGKIVVAGYSNTGGPNHFTLARYNIDGTLDTASFGTTGTGGTVVTPIGTGSIGQAVVIQPDGKIVVAGYSNTGGPNHFTLARYNIDGTLDKDSFGTGATAGTVVTPIGTGSIGQAVAIQPDGKIVVAGYSSNTGVPNHFTLARYNIDGTLDKDSFGSGVTAGTVAIPIGNTSIGQAVAIQPDGKIVVAGYSNTGGPNHFTLARYNIDGTLDTASFGTTGTGGTVVTPIGTGSIGQAVAIQPNGKILVTGYSSDTGVPNHFTLARYNIDGTLDKDSFGSGVTAGTVVTPIGNTSIGRSMVLQPDGKILVAGYSNTGGPNHFTLARYNIDGTFDTASFGTNGKGGTVVTPIGTGSIGQAVAIQTDGKVIIAGYSINTGVPSHFTLARYQTSAPPVLLRTTLSGSEEIPAVTTLATGSATFVISPGQNEISYTLHVADIGISGVTAVQIHFGTPGAEGRALFTLTSNSFVSPLVGKLTAADLEPIASTEGINTFSDAIKATRDGNTYIHVHTSTHLGGEIRGQILEAPPTLSQLQAEIFTQQCGAVCHRSGGLGGIETGLFLDTRENAFNLLVNVPSTQDSNFKRVEPFNPDASFLVKKLTDPSLGLMPAGGSPLRAEEIKKVRDWITAGAKND